MSAKPAHSSLTNTSLLSRVRNPDDIEAWREFESCSRDLLVRFCKSPSGGKLQQADAEDVAQAVLANLFRSMPRFKSDKSKVRLRDYLFRWARNASLLLRSRPNSVQSPSAPLEDVGVARSEGNTDSPDPVSSMWEKEWVAHHYRLALHELQ